jgi:hypothetical protein
MKQSSIEWIYNNLKSHFEHDGDLLEAVKMSFEPLTPIKKIYRIVRMVIPTTHRKTKQSLTQKRNESNT